MAVINLRLKKPSSLARASLLLAALLAFPVAALASASFRLTQIDYAGTGIQAVDQCLQQRTQAALNKPIDTIAVVALKQQLTNHCLHQLGYPLASVEVPDQNVRGGRLQLAVAMPLLKKLELNAKKGLPLAVPRALLNRLLDKPLYLPELQKYLARLEREASVAALHADIKQEVVAGQRQAKLTVELVEKPALTAALRVHNQQAASLGGEAATLELAANRLAGRAIEWRTNVDLGEGISGIGFGFDKRLSPDWRLHSAASVRRASVVEQPFDQLNIKTRIYQLQLGVNYRNDWKPNRHWNLRFWLDRQRSKSELLGQAFSFSPSADQGRLDSTAFRLSAGWQYLQRPAQSWQRLYAAHLQLNLGLTALGATAHDESDLADSDFVSAQSQLSLQQNIGASPWYSRLRMAAQVANKPLLPTEQVSLGGFSTVRGYRENSLVRDRAAWGSVGVGRNLWRDGSGKVRGRIEAFYDWGKASNVLVPVTSNTSTNQSDILASVGLATSWQPWKALSVDVAWAKPQRKRFNPRSDLQDSGWHFQLRYQLWPAQ